ncbi:DUF4142 domain-containing protein [Pontibacter oryzae]|uniref:DUF4142 domain-containing protein n=1 Tax=Pontibacter oryzae TaxID=2304593 RepID=A0A399S7L2_9BACT|nr:DUF4142 domain-containing protein [Pontibacter oryzae]RIJ37787.1 DUF4142 domain-containing protein [Pontibacter oryzae]
MKKIASTGLILSAFLVGMASCNQENGAVEEAQETNEMMADDTAMEDEMEDMSEFMTKAASGGMMEVELGKLAQEKGASQDVKNFGQMMVTDHTSANDKLKQLAMQKNIVLPDSMGEKHMEHVNELREKSGAEFDKAYMELMVNDHQEDVDLFQKAADNMQDADVKSFASSTVTVLQQHLDRAKQIHEGLK